MLAYDKLYQRAPRGPTYALFDYGRHMEHFLKNKQRLQRVATVWLKLGGIFLQRFDNVVKIDEIVKNKISQDVKFLIVWQMGMEVGV